MHRRNNRFLLRPGQNHIADAEICKHHFLHNILLVLAAFPDCVNGGFIGNPCCNQSTKFLLKPQIRLFRLGTVPLVGACEIQSVFGGTSGKCKLLLDTLPKFIPVFLSGENQRFSTIWPVIKVLTYNPVFIKGEAIGILDAVIIVDNLKRSRFRLPIHESKRLIRKFSSFERFGVTATDHFSHEQKRMNHITFARRICAVNCHNRHKFFFPVWGNQYFFHSFICCSFHAYDSSIFYRTMICYRKLK